MTEKIIWALVLLAVGYTAALLREGPSITKLQICTAALGVRA